MGYDFVLGELARRMKCKQCRDKRVRLVRLSLGGAEKPLKNCLGSIRYFLLASQRPPPPGRLPNSGCVKRKELGPLRSHRESGVMGSGPVDGGSRDS